MSENIDKIIYINLDQRTDRKEQIENELKNYDLFEKTERFQAIHTPDFGIVGCTISHLNVIKLAKERKYKNVLILEDDFYFIISKEEFEDELKKLFNNNVEYDICMLSYNLVSSEPNKYDFLIKATNVQTASGYIVNHTMYDKLIKIYEFAIPRLKISRKDCLYANDIIWKRLQPITNWYCFKKRCGKQRSGYSDNLKREINYDC